MVSVRNLRLLQLALVSSFLILGSSVHATKLVSDSSDVSTQTFSQQELNKIVAEELVVNSPISSPGDMESFLAQHSVIRKELSKYNVTGYSSCLDGNFAFFFNRQNPVFWVNFKDDSGTVMSKRYQAAIWSFGLKFELAFKLDFIFLVNTDSCFYNIEKPINLSCGVDVNASFGLGFTFTYVPFADVSGGMIIIGVPITPSILSYSIVTGGSLTPLA
ncbi:MAG: hypothetical protein ABH827_06085 [bacterium]